MTDPQEKLAVIKRVNCGVGDYGKMALWFETYTSEHTAALQVFHGEDMIRLVESSGLCDIKQLEGRACWVKEEGSMIRFLRLFDGKDGA